jgi:hypothetical protein
VLCLGEALVDLVSEEPVKRMTESPTFTLASEDRRRTSQSARPASAQTRYSPAAQEPIHGGAGSARRSCAKVSMRRYSA